MIKNNLTTDVFTIDNFLSQEECLSFIGISEEIGYEEATVTTPSGQRMIKTVRNNSRVIYKDFDLANKIWEKITAFIPS
ncbi:MAG: oxidoreductase, 2OG-Fe(II) oxygenase, partial [Flavobacteriales bacterium]|nr:oxidoreductase, 2OG-Fe(II) oxygenase [Flavobacteriales bacterium]